MKAKDVLVKTGCMTENSIFYNRVNYEEIDSFVNRVLNKIIERNTFEKVKSFIKNDNDIKLLNNFTHIVEIGTLRSIAQDKLYNEPDQIENYIIILLLSYNITLGTELNERGFSGLFLFPEQTKGYVYFSGMAIFMIKERVDGYMKEAFEHGTEALDVYVQELINANLII